MLGRNIDWWPLARPQLGTRAATQACARESNLQPFGLQDDAQPPEPRQPGRSLLVVKLHAQDSSQGF